MTLKTEALLASLAYNIQEQLDRINEIADENDDMVFYEDIEELLDAIRDWQSQLLLAHNDPMHIPF